MSQLNVHLCRIPPDDARDAIRTLNQRDKEAGNNEGSPSQTLLAKLLHAVDDPRAPKNRDLPDLYPIYPFSMSDREAREALKRLEEYSKVDKNPHAWTRGLVAALKDAYSRFGENPSKGASADYNGSHNTGIREHCFTRDC